MVGLCRRGEIVSKKYSTTPRADDMLRRVDALLVGQKIKLKELKGIVVVAGAESFTAARLSVTLANSLSYALDIPVRKVPRDKAFDCEFIAALFAKKSAGRYVLAEYNAEARVSFPRSH